ncbi:hypothetical protein ACFQT0_28750 [Hymenobacter humi]|uniref:Uncharacterized protein n=1 Tax=Hymenobacter humi TaxID=1411620 RepID=A0ABW2UF60_9BACT
MEHDLTFQKIKEQVELPELLTHYGYNLKKGEDLGKGKWHVFEGMIRLWFSKGGVTIGCTLTVTMTATKAVSSTG